MYKRKNGKIPLLSRGKITFEPMARVEVRVRVRAGVRVKAKFKVETKVVFGIEINARVLLKLFRYLNFKTSDFYLAKFKDFRLV